MAFSNPVSGIEQIKNYIFVSNRKTIYKGGFLFMANKLVLQKLFGDEKKRFIILTDMENEPDDSQTMVKLLLYSNEIDIEGLIAVTSCWLKDDVYPESIVSRIQAFGIVRANLMKHASGWPTTDYLLSITGGGQAGFGMEAVGEGKSTRGSEIIIQALLKEDPRPVYFSINAGANTLAQALYDMRNRLDKDILQVCLSKIRVFDDSGQDNAGAWINQEFPEVFYVRNSPQVYSLNGPDLNMGPQPWKPLNQFEWAEENVRKRHGILGELFPQRIMSLKGTGVPAGVVMLMYWFMDGGGTTGVLYVLNNGLNVPSEITWGGWGGRFRDKKRKIFAGESPQASQDPEYAKNSAGAANSSIDESAYEWSNMYGCTSDTWFDEDEKILYENNIFAPLWRFRKDILFDFQARMDWCVKEYSEANHHPLAKLYGDDGERAIMKAAVERGIEYEVDASASEDPDGDTLNFRWWIYSEAGTCKKCPLLKNEKSEVVTISIPEEAQSGDTIHLILEVFDENEIVSLKSYRRIILEVQ